MPIQFSSQLIERMQVHFRNRFGKEITKEQANEYLDSFADLFLLFAFPPEPPAPP